MVLKERTLPPVVIKVEAGKEEAEIVHRAAAETALQAEAEIAKTSVFLFMTRLVDPGVFFCGYGQPLIKLNLIKNFKWVIYQEQKK